MTSEKQLEANRKNALRSTGPKTEAGKTISSMNALKHGLRASEVVIPGEDPSEFESFRNELLLDLCPVGTLEMMLADRIISSFWRLRRSGRMENELFIKLMNPENDTSNDPAQEDIPFNFVLSGTRPDGTTYVKKHYRMSNASGVEDMLEDNTNHGTRLSVPDKQREDNSLGTIAIQDFSSGNILTRFRCYEGRIERSLYKALTELQRLQFLRHRSGAIINCDGI